MKRRKIKRERNVNPRLYKIPFIIAGALFALAAVLYLGGQIIKIIVPQQAVFASPYLRQNQFIDIEKKLNAIDMVVISQELSSNKKILTVQFEDGLVVIFSSSYDIDWQISSLHSIIYKLTIDNKQPKQVDFRFGKPVVKF